MAEGFAKKMLPDWASLSAGVQADGLNKFAIEVMAEIGVDISHQKSKTIESLGDVKPDIVVTLCDNAREACPNFPGAVLYEHWDMTDPAEAEGEEEDVIQVYQQVRDDIEEMIKELMFKTQN